MATADKLPSGNEPLDTVATVEEECLTLKEFLNEVLKDRDSLKREFDDLSANSREIVRRSSDLDDTDSEDTISENTQDRVFNHQLEKDKLDGRLKQLEEKLVEKQKLMSDLETKASAFLSLVTSGETNDEKSETAKSNDLLSRGTESEKEKQAKIEPTKENVGEAKQQAAVIDEKPTDKENLLAETKPPCIVQTKENSFETSSGPSLASDNPADQIECLSALVSDLRRVKDEMGKCMTVKEKSFSDIQNELNSAQKEQELLKEQIESFVKQLDDKENKFKSLAKENESFKSQYERKCSELSEASSKSENLFKEKAEMESRLRVLEVMMTEYKAEIQTVTDEKTQAEEQTKQVAKELSSANERYSIERMQNEALVNDFLSSEDLPTPDMLSTESLAKAYDESADQNFAIILMENKKLNEKLKITSNYLRTLAKEREVKREECVQMQEKVQYVEGKMLQIQNNFDTLVSAAMAERDDLVRDSAHKSSEISRLSELLMQLRNKEKEISEEVIKVNANNITLKTKIISLEEDLKSSKIQLVSLNEEKDRKIAEIRVEHERSLIAKDDDISLHKAEQNKLLIEIEKLNRDLNSVKEQSEEALKNLVPAEQLVSKEKECKNLECKIATLNSETSALSSTMKEEILILKENVSKLEEANVQLEVSNESLTEQNQDITREKDRLEETNKDSKEAAESEHKTSILSMLAEIDELKEKNASSSNEFREKETELNEELKAREATIQELRVTLTNNQKQSSENYKALQEDMNVMEVKFAKQAKEDESKLKELLNKIQVVQTEKDVLKKSVDEIVDDNISKIEEIEALKQKLVQLKSAVPSEITKGKDYESKNDDLEPAPETSENFDARDDEFNTKMDECNQSETSNQDKEVGVAQQTSEAGTYSEKDPIEPESYPENSTFWTGSLDELKQELDGAKEELIKLSEQTLPPSDTDDSEQKETKIAALVRRVEELSGLLAVTRIRRGIVSKGVSEGRPEEPSVSSNVVDVVTEQVAPKDHHISEDKGTGTWRSFASQKEFEEFISRKAGENCALEAKLKALENSLSSKSVYINELELELKSTQDEANDCKAKLIQDQKPDVNTEIDADLDKLKENLESSRSECNDLRNVISNLENQSSEYENDKVELVRDIEERVLKSLPTDEDTSSPDNESGNEADLPTSGTESGNEEVKKNLDEQLKLALKRIESKVLNCIDKNDQQCSAKLIEVEKNYRDKILSIKDEYNKRISTLIESKNPLSSSVYFAEKIHILEDNIEKLRVLVVEMDESKTNIEERMKVSENKVSLLNDVKRKLIDYTKSIEDKLCSTDKQYNRSKEDKMNSIKQIESLTKENEELTLNISSLNEKNESLLLKISSLELLSTENEKLKTTMEKNIDDSKDEIIRLKESLEGCMSERDVLAKYKSNCSLQIKQFEDKIEHLTSQLNLLTEEKSAIETLNKQLGEDLLAKESNCIASVFKCDELTQINTSLNADVVELNSKISSLEQEKLKFEDELLKLQECLGENNTVINDLKNEVSSKDSLISIGSEEGKVKTDTDDRENKINSLNSQVTKLMKEKDELRLRYEEDQRNILEMQNMMVSDMEKLILNLESDKKMLQEKLKIITNENRTLQNLTSGKKTSNPINVTDQLLSQIRELQQKLTNAQEELLKRDLEFQEKLQAEQGGSSVKLKNLQEDIKEEIDLMESRKEEETEELCEKFAHLEVEFTSKLAEMKEYYESLLADEKAEFGRVLVMKVDEYEKSIAEKTDEIVGWETKFASMKQELDNKTIVIEELEERLDDSNYDPNLSDDMHHFKFTPIVPSKDLSRRELNISERPKKGDLQSSRSLDISLSDVDIPCMLDTKSSPTKSKPILSLVIPSTFSEGDSTLTTDVFDSQSRSEGEHSVSPPSAFKRVGKSSSITPVRTAVFVSRDFPTDDVLHSCSSTSSVPSSRIVTDVKSSTAIPRNEDPPSSAISSNDDPPSAIPSNDRPSFSAISSNDFPSSSVIPSTDVPSFSAIPSNDVLSSSAIPSNDVLSSSAIPSNDVLSSSAIPSKDPSSSTVPDKDDISSPLVLKANSSSSVIQNIDPSSSVIPTKDPFSPVIPSDTVVSDDLSDSIGVRNRNNNGESMTGSNSNQITSTGEIASVSDSASPPETVIESQSDSGFSGPDSTL